MISNVLETLKNLPRVTKVVVGVSVLGIMLVIVVAVVATRVSMVENVALVDVTNFEEVSDVPRGYRGAIEQSIGNIIKSNEATSGLVFSDAVIRDGTYKEEVNGDVITATFIVDVESLRYSFDVTVVWPKDTSDFQKITDPDVTITCPYYLDVIYKDRKCIAQSPEQQIRTYLPHYERLGGGQKFGVSLKKYNDEFYLAVEVKSCGDAVVAEAAADATKKWIKSIYMDPNDFKIEVADICEARK